MTEKYLKIREDGSAALCELREYPRSVSNDILNNLNDRRFRKVHVAWRVNEMPVTIHTSDTECYLSVELRHITIKTNFSIDSEGVLRPLFLSEGSKNKEASDYPSFSAKWVPPSGMLVKFIARVRDFKNSPSSSEKDSCFIVALDSINRCYRLPLPNLYGDCAMCMGKFDGRSSCIKGALDLALEQLEKSEWNSDLFCDSRKIGTDAMMRFKLVGEDIQQISFEGDWTQFCEKVATPITEILIS